MDWGRGMNLKHSVRAWKIAFQDIYNLKDENAKGRAISLASGLLTAFYNVFITGIFYTGFLSMYGIDITGVGIITFIPYIASCFSIFSSVILERIQKRKKILVASKIYFYAVFILATTVMPELVRDNQARLVWFAVLLFLAYSVYALFSPGFTPWFYAFYPSDNERRTRFFQLNQIFSSIMSSVVLITSGLIADALRGSPYQNQLIIGFRYFAFLLVIVDVTMQAQAVEYPYPKSPKIRFGQVFTLPFRYKKFMWCLGLMFCWNYIANLNNGIWGYHLLNHMHFSYTLMNTMSVAYTFILIFTSSLWRKMLMKYSWVKTFGIANLIWIPTEIFFFLMTPERKFIYIPNSIWQNILSVGFNLSYSNILYMNLPEENSTAHIAFYSIGANLFAFLGLMTGTYVSGLTGDATMPFLGMQIYSLQFTTLMRAVAQCTLGLICVLGWKRFTRDQDIQEVETHARVNREMKQKRKLLKAARNG